MINLFQKNVGLKALAALTFLLSFQSTYATEHVPGPGSWDLLPGDVKPTILRSVASDIVEDVKNHTFTLSLAHTRLPLVCKEWERACHGLGVSLKITSDDYKNQQFGWYLSLCPVINVLELEFDELNDLSGDDGSLVGFLNCVHDGLCGKSFLKEFKVNYFNPEYFFQEKHHVMSQVIGLTKACHFNAPGISPDDYLKKPCFAFFKNLEKLKIDDVASCSGHTKNYLWFKKVFVSPKVLPNLKQVIWGRCSYETGTGVYSEYEDERFKAPKAQ